MVLGVLLVLAASPSVSSRLGYTPPLGIADAFPDGSRPPSLPLYAPGDPWKAWLADEQTCPRGEDANAPRAVQAQVLLCLVNYARRRQGLQGLARSKTLDATAARKASDIVRCRDFRHQACGRPAFQAAHEIGYRGALGENLYMAEGSLVAPRPALDGWLNSTGHRRNLFEPRWKTIGIARLGGAGFDGMDDGVVWVNQFG